MERQYPPIRLLRFFTRSSALLSRLRSLDTCLSVVVSSSRFWVLGVVLPCHHLLTESHRRHHDGHGTSCDSRASLHASTKAPRPRAHTRGRGTLGRAGLPALAAPLCRRNGRRRGAKYENPKELERIALDVFEYVDSDGDGGLFFDEWEVFSEKNWCFVRFTHCYQTHMRKVVFGNKYWVEKTRALKAKNAKGVNALSLTSRINRKDELWTVHELKDGAIDGRGRPYIAPEWKQHDTRDVDATEGLENNQKMEADDLAQEILDKKDNPNDPVWGEEDENMSEGAKAKKAEEKKRLEEEQER